VDELQGRRVLVYVSGSIAAVKSGEVVTLLRRRGAETRVAMTESATRFVTPLALQSLSGHAVVTDLFREARARHPGGRSGAGGDDPGSGHGMEHLQLAAGASASLIARLALGLADDAVTATALACQAPLMIAPAMETAMWEHPATREHVETLRGRGAVLVGPVSGRLASGREAMGRMAEPAEIVRAAVELLTGLGGLPSGLSGAPDAGER
jgi:phosphopantothenoylcysteine decarboxylase/phosphopantothenate--cysteine ligase